MTHDQTPRTAPSQDAATGLAAAAQAFADRIDAEIYRRVYALLEAIVRVEDDSRTNQIHLEEARRSVACLAGGQG